MATTHAFAALAVAAVVARVVPEVAVGAATGAIVGGVVPDLDLVADHRKTLHFPVYYAPVAAAAICGALLVPTNWTVGLAMGLVAAAGHSAMDGLGGGLEPKPWEARSDEAVFSHYHDRWLAPRRWIRYDGAPEDLALAVALAIPALVVFDGVVRDVALVMLAVSACYAAVRKPLVVVAERLLARLPPSLLAVVPSDLAPVEDGDGEAPSEDGDR